MVHRSSPILQGTFVRQNGRSWTTSLHGHWNRLRERPTDTEGVASTPQRSRARSGRVDREHETRRESTQTRLGLPLIPRYSMYAIYAYIDPQNHPNVGIYAIHGVSGICLLMLIWGVVLRVHVLWHTWRLCDIFGERNCNERD